MTAHRIAVVTGSSAGIGRATALAFARKGYDVALLARDTDGLDAARREIEALGRRALPVPTDVADHDQVEAAASRIEIELGPIDVWVNNAMATIYSPFMDIRPEEFRRATDVTYHGAVYGTLAALKRMRRRNRGKIVQVGSALSYRAIPLQAPYCGAKFALRGFTDALRCELLHDRSRVRLTMVQLCAFNTPQFDWGRSHLRRRTQPVPPIYQPEVAAKAIVWAAEHRRRELWVGFATVRTIFAQYFFPGLLDRFAARFGYRGQLTDDQLPNDYRDNLFVPVPGDHGAHGRFNATARPRSVHLWLTTRRSALFAAVGIVAIALFLAH